MSRELVFWPSVMLKVPTEPVTEFDVNLTRLVVEMFQIMGKNEGVGLAGPQVGERKSIIVVKCDKIDEVFINPKMTIDPDCKIALAGEQCLSFPGIQIPITRPTEIHLEWQNVEGIWEERDFEGFPAQVIQHEMEHLEGKTILHHLSVLKRDWITRKIVKYAKRKKRAQST